MSKGKVYSVHISGLASGDGWFGEHNNAEWCSALRDVRKPESSVFAKVIVMTFHSAGLWSGTGLTPINFMFLDANLQARRTGMTTGFTPII